MKNIFIGFLFIFLDFSINLGNSKIGLIPDFVGYIVMIKGLCEMEKESPLFIKVTPFATVMVIYSGFLYLLDLVGARASLGVVSYVLALLSTIVSLYISYNIVMGVIDTERKYGTDLNGDSLKSTWNFLAVFNALTFAFIIIPGVALISVFISFIVAICFLVAFNKSKNLYYNIVR